MQPVQPAAAHLRASGSTRTQARFTNPLTHPHARLVTARRVEPGELPAVAPRQLTITAATGPASVPQEDKTGSAAKESRAQKVVLNTIVYKKQKAYYLAPEDATAARGVVLFLHGFAQSPKAYALLYKALVADNLLVVAPDPRPMFSLSTQELQGAIVESAAFWGDLLVRNEFPPIKLASADAARNIGLLGHSVGAGVATYVAKEAAAASPPRPFKAVMYMAAQTQVYDKYLPAAAAHEWSKLEPELRSTQLSLQYGFADLIAFSWLSQELANQLKGVSTPPAQPPQRATYWAGTHVGFEDQLFIGDLNVIELLSPRANVVLLALTLLIAAGLSGVVRGVDSSAIIQFLLLQRAAPEDRDKKEAGGVAKFAASRRPEGSKAGALIDAKQILDMPARSAPSAATAPAAGGVGAATAPAFGAAAGAEPGLSAGEKALLLLQLAVDERYFFAKQQPPSESESSDPPETVTILPSEEAWWRYVTMLLLPSFGLSAATYLASTASEAASHHCPEWKMCTPALQQYCRCILTWISVNLGFVALLLAVISVGGVLALGVQVYVDLCQRPVARVKAAEFFRQQLVASKSK